MTVGLVDAPALLPEQAWASSRLGERPFTFRDRRLLRATPDEEPVHRSEGATAPITILVVDDDADMLTTLYDMLAPGGYRVVTAVDGEDGLGKFTRTAVDVVITDLAMPRVNGLQLARGCKRIKPAVPVLMVTAWDVLLSDDDLVANGVDVVLPKPLRASTLRSAIAEAIRRSAP